MTTTKLILVPCISTYREYYPDGGWVDWPHYMWVPDDGKLIERAEYWRDKDADLFHRFMAHALKHEQEKEKENNNG